MIIYINNVDVTNYISNVNWSDNFDALGVELKFEIAREFFDTVKLGDKIIMKIKNEVIFAGILVARDLKEKIIECTCYDFAWYLNKSTIIKQIKNLKGNEAIIKICNELGIKVKVNGANAVINNIYKDKTLIEVIKDILDKSTQFTGNKFNLEMNVDVLEIEPLKKIVINDKFELGEDEFLDINLGIGDVTYSESVIELKNAILVVASDEDADRTIGEAQDNASINKYGKLQQVITLDAENYKSGYEVAKTNLKQLNKITQNISLTLLGSPKIKAGRVINLNVPRYNLKGEYLIKSSTHSIDGKLYKVNIKVEEYK